MEYVAIVISSLALIAIIIAIVLIVRNSNKKVDAPQLYLKEIGALQQQLEGLYSSGRQTYQRLGRPRGPDEQRSYPLQPRRAQLLLRREG